MSSDNALSSASLDYTEAHAAHYKERNLLGALRAYGRVIASYPSAPEAGHSCTQIRNIVNLVVPAEELLNAQMELALRHLPSDGDATSST